MIKETFNKKKINKNIINFITNKLKKSIIKLIKNETKDIEYSKDELEKSYKSLLEFAQKHPNWHSFYKGCEETSKAIDYLKNKNLIEVKNNRFKIKNE